MLEKEVEKRIVKFATENGCVSLKLEGQHNRGKPDRMFLKDGKILFLEIKAPKKKPTALQTKWLSDLTALGFQAHWVDSVSAGQKLIADLLLDQLDDDLI